jgi:hypothetical protein
VEKSEKTSTGTMIAGGVGAVAVVAAVVYWWPKKYDKGAKGKKSSDKSEVPPPSKDAAPPPPPAGPPADAPPVPALVPSPSVRDAASSRGRFVPGAPRPKPLVRISHWHSFPPGAVIMTTMMGGKFVQRWSVAPDGVTLTATDEPQAATPELLARAKADLASSKAIGKPPSARKALPRGRGHGSAPAPHSPPQASPAPSGGGAADTISSVVKGASGVLSSLGGKGGAGGSLADAAASAFGGSGGGDTASSAGDALAGALGSL